jgi:mono/diheme cytochrome c family protein
MPPLNQNSCGDGRPRLSGRAKLDGLLAVILLLPAIALSTACRLDMQVQPKQSPFVRSDFFPDQRSERPLVEGTVARGQLHSDAYLYTGKLNGAFGDYLPFPLTKEALQRGRQRYDIYCSPCHSLLGDGKGFVPLRGFSRLPPSYHTARLQKAPLGYIFDVITNGYGIMPDYRSQIGPEDRWKIVAYVRALQLSENATKGEVPPGQAIPSQPPKFSGLGSGATLPVIEPERISSSEESK